MPDPDQIERVELLARARKTMVESRATHVAWIDHLEQCPNCPDVNVAGDIEHHRETVKGYDDVLLVLDLFDVLAEDETTKALIAVLDVAAPHLRALSRIFDFRVGSHAA